MLVHDLDVTVINRDTGEIIRELTINPDKDNQPLGRTPGPTTRTHARRHAQGLHVQEIRMSRDTP